MTPVRKPIEIKFFTRHMVDAAMEIERANRYPVTSRWLDRTIDSDLAHAQAIADDRTLFGYFITGRTNSGYLPLMRLAIHPQHRRQGHGRRIIEHLQERARKRSKILTCWVREYDVETQLFLQACGFVCRTTVPGAYFRDGPRERQDAFYFLWKARYMGTNLLLADQPYRREGQCDCNGRCCDFLVYTMDGWGGSADYAKLHGEVFVDRVGRENLMIPVACRNCEQSGKCSVFDTDQMPEVCRQFPVCPTDGVYEYLLQTDRPCGFRFVDAVTGEPWVPKTPEDVDKAVKVFEESLAER